MTCFHCGNPASCLYSMPHSMAFEACTMCCPTMGSKNSLPLSPEEARGYAALMGLLFLNYSELLSSGWYRNNRMRRDDIKVIKRKVPYCQPP